MKLNKKDAFTFIFEGLFTLFLAYTACTLFLIPLISYCDYSNKNAVETGKLYTLSKNGDKEAFEKIKELSFRGSSPAFVALIIFSRDKSLKEAEIDMDKPNVDFSPVDLKESNALVLRAVQQLGDVELNWVLLNASASFDDEESAKTLAIANNKSDVVALQNKLRFQAYSTFDQATKDSLKACKIKLEERLSGPYGVMRYFRSSGTCTDTASDGSMINATKEMLHFLARPFRAVTPE